jgi:hypothetical protein
LRVIVFIRARSAGSLFAEVIYNLSDYGRSDRPESGFTAGFQVNSNLAGCGFPRVEK